MGTASEERSAATGERQFFLVMALAIAATVVAGLGLAFYLGRAVYSELPWQVHVHAAVFSSWIVFYVAQNWLIVDGRIALHRRMGMLGAVIASLMVPLGLTATVMALARHAVPPFFPPGIFLVLDGLGIIGFGGLIAAAIILRRRPDWHKRLMLCGTILVMSPALGRLLPMPLLGSFAPLAVYSSMILYVLAGVLFDLANRRRVHPAYWWGGGAITVIQLAVGPLGFSPPVLAVVSRIVG